MQSDFGATHSTALSLNAGEDFEMQSGNFYSTTRINAALADGSLTIGTIDRALSRRYVQMFKFGIFDRPITHTPIDTATAQAHGAVARSIGEQIAVLLKNNGNMLPLDASQRPLDRSDRAADVRRRGCSRRWRQLAGFPDVHDHAVARTAKRADAAWFIGDGEPGGRGQQQQQSRGRGLRGPGRRRRDRHGRRGHQPKEAIGPISSLPNNQDALISGDCRCSSRTWSSC